MYLFALIHLYSTALAACSSSFGLSHLSRQLIVSHHKFHNLSLVIYLASSFERSLLTLEVIKMVLSYFFSKLPFSKQLFLLLTCSTMFHVDDLFVPSPSFFYSIDVILFRVNFMHYLLLFDVSLRGVSRCLTLLFVSQRSSLVIWGGISPNGF